MPALKLSLLAGAATVSAYVSAPWLGAASAGQSPLGPALHGSASTGDFKCDLPPVLDPAGDGLPSANELFSSKEALETQVKRHQAIVRVPSVCFDDLGDVGEDSRWAPFHDLHDTLAKTYPIVHKRAKLEKINTLGLVYTIEGSDSSLKPIMLAAHQDVVPVADESTWDHPPFDAYWDGEWLWGRGASDDKNSLTGIMSALEALLSDDVAWTPRRTVVLAFGFDEECSGYRGAGSIAEHLEARYGKDSVAIVLDEGGLSMIDYGDAMYALPAVTEKGHVDIWFELHVVGGHSSIPFPHTGIGIVAEIVAALEANPYEAELLVDSPVYNHLACMARYTPDVWPEVTDRLSDGKLDAVAAELVGMSPATQFMIQTSQAVDFIAGGQKINAMPEVTTLGVNYRVAPQDSVGKVQHNVVKYISEIVDKYNLTLKAFEGDERYEKYVAEHGANDQNDGVAPLYDVDYKGTLVVEAREASEVAPISPTSGPVWDTFSGTIQHTFTTKGGPTVPVGQTMTGNTDTRHYWNLTPNIYRWTPVGFGGAENIHTINERIRMDAHMEMIKFYYDFIRNFDAADVE